MAQYFLQGTPLAGLERQLMAPSRCHPASAAPSDCPSEALAARAAGLHPAWDAPPHFADRGHRARLAKLLAQGRPPGNRLAALYLLTASETLWARVAPGVSEGTVDFTRASLRGIGVRDYTLYQAAAGFLTRTSRVSPAELADPELVDDAALRLILWAEHIARHGAEALDGKQAV